MEIKKKQITLIQFIVYCPYCDREIKSTSKSQLIYNLNVHKRQKHSKERAGLLKEIIKEIKEEGDNG